MHQCNGLASWRWLDRSIESNAVWLLVCTAQSTCCHVTDMPRPTQTSAFGTYLWLHNVCITRQLAVLSLAARRCNCSLRGQIGQTWAPDGGGRLQPHFFGLGSGEYWDFGGLDMRLVCIMRTWPLAGKACTNYRADRGGRTRSRWARGCRRRGAAKSSRCGGRPPP